MVYTLPQGPDPDAALFSESGAMNVMFFLDKVGLGRCGGSLSLRHVQGYESGLVQGITKAKWTCSICKSLGCCKDLT